MEKFIDRPAFEALLAERHPSAERFAEKSIQRYFRPGPGGSYLREEYNRYEYRVNGEVVATWFKDFTFDICGIKGIGRIKV